MNAPNSSRGGFPAGPAKKKPADKQPKGGIVIQKPKAKKGGTMNITVRVNKLVTSGPSDPIISSMKSKQRYRGPKER